MLELLCTICMYDKRKAKEKRQKSWKMIWRSKTKLSENLLKRNVKWLLLGFGDGGADERVLDFVYFSFIYTHHSFTPSAGPRVFLLLVLPPVRFIKFHLLYYKSIHIVICCGWCVLAAISRRLGKTITTNPITNTTAIGLVILPHTPQTDVLRVGSVVSRPFVRSQQNNWWLCFPFTLIYVIPSKAKGWKDMKFFWWTSHPMPANRPTPSPKHDKLDVKEKLKLIRCFPKNENTQTKSKEKRIIKSWCPLSFNFNLLSQIIEINEKHYCCHSTHPRSFIRLEDMREERSPRRHQGCIQDILLNTTGWWGLSFLTRRLLAKEEKPPYPPTASIKSESACRADPATGNIPITTISHIPVYILVKCVFAQNILNRQ